MVLESVHDRAVLADLLRRDAALHTYELGDLDDFFWPHTNWFRFGDAVALLYHGLEQPTLLALAQPQPLGRLLRAMQPVLPRRFYAHLSIGGAAALDEGFHSDHHGLHRKMALTDPGRLDAVEPAGDVLGTDDGPDLVRLYAQAYPGNWFDRRMLETGQYIGLRQEGELVAVAGVHVWSPVYRVAALGNVTTHPAVRGRGFAAAVVARLCRQLLQTVDLISLNVMAANATAIGVYDRLGFTQVAEYEEIAFTARQTSV